MENKLLVRKCALYGINAVLPDRIIIDHKEILNNILKKNYKNIYVIGFGKGSSLMAGEIEKILGDSITKGIVIDVQTKKLAKIEVIKGTHPILSHLVEAIQPLTS